ncbi:MAG: hypothetical protein LUG95_04405 [Clostridiales bacterium]|nr:hypothetical protein [Clostridiales bacterium]
MKRIISVFLCIAAVCLLFFTGCESNDDANNTIIIDGTEFETVNTDWTVYTEATYNGEYYLYGNDSGIIFAEAEDNELFDGVVYHSTDDTYPDISSNDKIEKITVDTENSELSLDSDISSLFCDEMNRVTLKNDFETDTADLSKADIYVNVYYEDYPAYQTEFVICFSENGVPGIMYCETSRNTAAFGENNMMLFSNETLIEYFNSI